MRRLIVLLVLLAPLAVWSQRQMPTTSDAVYRGWHKTRILSAALRDGRLEVTYLHRSGARTLELPHGHEVPGHLVKVIYGCVDGKVAVVDTIQGRHIVQRIAPERFEFPKTD